MPRIRTVKPEFFKHEELYQAEIEEKLPLRIAFVGLWCICDREGRFKWRPNQIKLDVLPYDKVDFERVLNALCSRGFVEQYTADDELFGYIPTFLFHQVINNRESESHIPSPFDASSTRDPHGLSKIKGKGKERKDIKREIGFIPEGINEKLLSEFLKVRRIKKVGPLTEIAYNAIVREANKVGWSIEQALTKCCEKSWATFEASWIKDNPDSNETHPALRNWI